MGVSLRGKSCWRCMKGGSLTNKVAPNVKAKVKTFGWLNRITTGGVMKTLHFVIFVRRRPLRTLVGSNYTGVVRYNTFGQTLPYSVAIMKPCRPSVRESILEGLIRCSKVKTFGKRHSKIRVLYRTTPQTLFPVLYRTTPCGVASPEGNSGSNREAFSCSLPS